jgi:putative PIN family toxin of toxin-antitoxin system
MTKEKPRAVFDAMVYLQAMVNDQGPAFACKRLVDEGKVILVVSPTILEEAKEVGNRPSLQRKFKNLTSENVTAFLQDLRAKAVEITEVPQVFRYPRDPDDEPYINLAIAADARYLVSRDKDLLDLMADKVFRRRFPHLVILDPVALLRELADQNQ